MRGKRFCGHKGDASWEECVPKIYKVKRTQVQQLWQREVIAYKLIRLVYSV